MTTILLSALLWVSFELGSVDAVVTAGERVSYALTWTVPGDSWLDLNTIEMRFGEAGSLLWLVFEEATRTFRLRNPASGEIGPAVEPGSRTVLSAGGAKLHLSETAVIAAGPDSPEVTLLLALEFEPPAIGEELSVEIAATSDEGVSQDFAHAGTLTILPEFVVHLDFAEPPVDDVVVNSAPDGVGNDGTNAGASWIASEDGHDGVMRFDGAVSQKILQDPWRDWAAENALDR